MAPATLERVQRRLAMLDPDERTAIIEAVDRALAPIAAPSSPVVAALMGGRRVTPQEQVAAEVTVLMRSFARRRELLAETLTAPQVADILGTTRQTPHDRLKSGTLLAALDHGAQRFPIWQFDPEGEDGVITGLPEVIRALQVSPIARMNWLIQPNDMLDGETPLGCLKAGEVERVVALARAVGID